MANAWVSAPIVVIDVHFSLKLVTMLFSSTLPIQSAGVCGKGNRIIQRLVA
jgi:hypothetical protein